MEHAFKKTIGNTFFLVVLFIITFLNGAEKNIPTVSVSPAPILEKGELYTGPVYHIFFHSLIIYPELAFDGTARSKTFKEYLITQSEFIKILPLLYKENFVLIDIRSLYRVDSLGNVHSKDVYVPRGKKPLVLSLDDLSYYRNQRGRGLANKLVLDAMGKVATEVITPGGNTVVTRDGDVVPLLDDFVTAHPDFSFNGAKGLVALTGYDGILGYRTQLDLQPDLADSSIKREEEIKGAKKIVEKMKETGWIFGSHSYSHRTEFIHGTMSLADVQKDTELWKAEVEPIVGDTNIFVGPFGQIFSRNDPRQEYLISEGFKMLCGVYSEPYLKYFSDHVVMQRADIDGIRLMQTPHLLKDYFDPQEVIDPERMR